MIALAAGLAFLALAAAPGATAIAPFSASRPGLELPAGWQRLALPRVREPSLSLVEDEGATVLRSHAEAAAGTAAFAIAGPAPARARLAWRWKVDRVVERADLERKDGDDFAARVYVFFDVPAEAVPFASRVKIFLARAFYGREIPTAAICYVWDNRHAAGTSLWNPYTDRVRTVVLRSGAAGAWASESRDLEADFRAAFGAQWPRPMPRVTGIAAGNDTDQTGESVTAWFGDFRLEAGP